MKKDFSPTRLDFGGLEIQLARHFGFCYGVENAIEIAFQTLEEHPGRRIFLLSEMIHNPQVNADLQSRGIRFLQDTTGKQLIPFSSLTADDIVLIPAFGTTLEIQDQLHQIGIQTEAYNTTCPFVEKVWNRSEVIAGKNYTVIIHGKPGHEETRATFSHAASYGPSLIVKDMMQAQLLTAVIQEELSEQDFYTNFKGQYSLGFDPKKDLFRIGVVNQTTMLASDTQAIADLLKTAVVSRYGKEEQVADTRDTLCYATNDNQSAVMGLLEAKADLAIVVGGYNSSNTSHLVELCEQKLPTYFISSADKMISRDEIMHFDLQEKSEKKTQGYLPAMAPARILISSGASCPDALVEAVIERLCELTIAKKNTQDLLAGFQQ